MKMMMMMTMMMRIILENPFLGARFPGIAWCVPKFPGMKKLCPGVDSLITTDHFYGAGGEVSLCSL